MEARSAPARCLHWLIPSALPRIAAAQRAHFCWPMAAARRSIPPRRWRANLTSRSPNSTGSAAAGRILLAAPITLAEIEARFADRIDTARRHHFRSGKRQPARAPAQRLGAIALAEQPMPVDADEDSRAHAGRRHRALGIDRLPWTKALRQWRDRVMFLRAGRRRRNGPICPTPRSPPTRIGWRRRSPARRRSPNFRPTNLPARSPRACPIRCGAGSTPRRRPISTAPTGSQVPIDYEAEGGPKIAIRVQELFGLDRHPAIAGGKIPLLVELLSPAHRPVQMTRDLPGFWRGSYAAVRAEMRGRYPKHPWPDNPLTAPPTRRAKRSR